MSAMPLRSPVSPSRHEAADALERLERQFVGALLLADDDERLLIQRLAVPADAITTAEARVVYAAALSLTEHGGVDSLLLIDAVVRLTGWSRKDAVAAVDGLLNDGVGATQLEERARRILAHAERRRLASVLQKGLELTECPDINPRELLQEVTLCLEDARERIGLRRVPLLSIEQLLALPAPTFLVDRIIPAGGLVGLYGPPGSGKSFLALALALDVALGHRFLGFDVSRGATLYVAGEGVGGIGARVAAHLEHRGVQAGRPPFVVVPEPVPLLDAAAVSQFILAVQASDLRPRLVILDTLARCLVGGDENAARDVGLAMEAASTIQRELQTAVLIVHHARKDGESERGSTAFRGAVDALWAVRGEDGTQRLVAEKMKDAPAPAPITFALRQFAASAVVVTANEALQLTADELPPSERLALESLQRGAHADGASTSQWRDLCGQKPRTFYLAAKSLTEKGLVAREGQRRGARYLLTTKGEEWLTANCKATANDAACSAGSLLHATPPLLGGVQHCSNEAGAQAPLGEELADTTRVPRWRRA